MPDHSSRRPARSKPLARTRPLARSSPKNVNIGRVDKRIADAVEALASDERRSRSNMVEVLLEEALKGRGRQVGAA